MMSRKVWAFKTTDHLVKIRTLFEISKVVVITYGARINNHLLCSFPPKELFVFMSLALRLCCGDKPKKTLDTTQNFLFEGSWRLCNSTNWYWNVRSS